MQDGSKSFSMGAAVLRLCEIPTAKHGAKAGKEDKGAAATDVARPRLIESWGQCDDAHSPSNAVCASVPGAAVM